MVTTEPNFEALNVAYVHDNAASFTPVKATGSNGNNTSNSNEDPIDGEIKFIGRLSFSTSQSFEHQEGGWGWLVLFAVTWTYGFILSGYTNFSLIYTNLIDFYNSTEANNVAISAWIGSLSYGVQFLSSVMASVLVDLFGSIRVGLVGTGLSTLGLVGSALLFDAPALIRLHFLTYGLIFGFGQSLLMTSAFAILPHYFNKKIGLVNGIMSAGGSFMIVCTSVLLGQLLEKLGLKITFYVLAATTLTNVFTVLTFRPQLPRKSGHQSFCAKLKDSLALGVLRKPRFLIWCFSTILGMYGNAVPVLTMSHYAVLHFEGFRPEILSVIYGISSGVSSILFGKLIDKLKVSNAYNYILSYLAYAIGTMLIQFTHNLYVYCALICLFSVFDGLFMCSLIPMACETAESSLHANQALGYYNTIITVSLVMGPAASGMLFELYGNYDLAYTIAYVTSFAAVGVLLCYPRLGVRTWLMRLFVRARWTRRSNTLQQANVTF